MKRLIVGGLAALAIGLTGCGAIDGAPTSTPVTTSIMPGDTPEGVIDNCDQAKYGIIHCPSDPAPPV